uniref:Uncharacterized protein n=1 Tax=Dulem virus 229 TaxID=3145706 RepID=A0AAU8AYP5_9VIRU
MKKYFVPLILGACALMLCTSFVVSLTSLSIGLRNQKEITQIQSSITQLTKVLNDRLDAIDAHVSLIEKYAQANYEWFYGNQSENVESTAKGLVVIQNNGKSKSKQKK